jgi:hypothetical protein
MSSSVFGSKQLPGFDPLVQVSAWQVLGPCSAFWPPARIVPKECAEVAAITKTAGQLKNPSRNRLTNE